MEKPTKHLSPSIRPPFFPNPRLFIFIRPRSKTTFHPASTNTTPSQFSQKTHFESEVTSRKMIVVLQISPWWISESCSNSSRWKRRVVALGGEVSVVVGQLGHWRTGGWKTRGVCFFCVFFFWGGGWSKNKTTGSRQDARWRDEDMCANFCIETYWNNKRASQVGKDESPLDSVSSWIVPGMLKKGSPQENLAGLESLEHFRYLKWRFSPI